jgi:CRISPR system Cascade subunit CasC
MSHDPLFLQIHALTPYSAALLNRDDVGRAKRMSYGGSSRIRISSQCLKRHWREVDSAWALTGIDDPMTGGPSPETLRSRKIFSRRVGAPLVGAGHSPDDVVAVVIALRDRLLGRSDRAEAKKAARPKKAVDPAAADPEETLAALDTEQVIVLGEPEIRFIRTVAETLLQQQPNDPKAAVDAYFKRKEVAENLRTLRLAAGIDAALFGRMVTSDILARGDGAIHVAHALTVHAEESEPDYFVAIDDITRAAGELGTGLIQTSELTSGLFYVYVVVDVGQLVSNLEGCDATEWRSADLRLARQVVERLVPVIATTSPGAKLGSTAPYSYADLVMAEAGGRQPRSLMTAFHSPVGQSGARAEAVTALARHLAAFDAMYGREEKRRVASLLPIGDLPAEPGAGVSALAAWAAGQISGGA